MDGAMTSSAATTPYLFRAWTFRTFRRARLVSPRRPLDPAGEPLSEDSAQLRASTRLRTRTGEQVEGASS